MSTSTTTSVADPSSAHTPQPSSALRMQLAASPFAHSPFSANATGATASATSAGPKRPKPLVELWHPWVSRCWPSTATEETAFVADLLTQLGPVADGAVTRDFDRRDVTALVTALRCGLTLDELLARAHGLRPARLLAAHTHLEVARAAGEEAWRAIVDMATSAALAHYGPVAATLLPVIVSHLDAIGQRTPSDLARSVLMADAEISRTTQSVLLLEERLDTCVAPSERGRAIGGLLYDAYGDGAWALGTFLPRRVGTLVPLRVASLLGEDTPGRLRQAS